jgi:hypothetical protein
VLHISNRYLDLEAVLAATVKEAPELKGVVMSDDEADGSYASTTSTVAVFAKDEDVLGEFRARADAYGFKETALRPWTDDYSDILGPFLSKMRR